MIACAVSSHCAGAALGESVDSVAARGSVERDLAAAELVWIQPAEKQVGIGEGGFSAAFCVADGAWRRAGTLRSDTQEAAGVDPGDRTSAGADRPDVDHRRLDGHAELNLESRRSTHLASYEQADIGRCSSDVDGHDVIDSRK